MAITILLQKVFVLLILIICLYHLNAKNDDALEGNEEREEESDPIVSCETSQGLLRIQVHSEWAPLGAKRFVDLIKDEFFTDIAFFRCVKGFLTQFGISENPDKKHWHRETIKDDPDLKIGIKKHYVSFAGGGV